MYTMISFHQNTAKKSVPLCRKTRVHEMLKSHVQVKRKGNARFETSDLKGKTNLNKLFSAVVNKHNIITCDVPPVY